MVKYKIDTFDVIELSKFTDSNRFKRILIKKYGNDKLLESFLHYIIYNFKTPSDTYEFKIKILLRVLFVCYLFNIKVKKI